MRIVSNLILICILCSNVAIAQDQSIDKLTDGFVATYMSHNPAYSRSKLDKDKAISSYVKRFNNPQPTSKDGPLPKYHCQQQSEPKSKEDWAKIGETLKEMVGRVYKGALAKNPRFKIDLFKQIDSVINNSDCTDRPNYCPLKLEAILSTNLRNINTPDIVESDFDERSYVHKQYTNYSGRLGAGINPLNKKDRIVINYNDVLKMNEFETYLDKLRIKYPGLKPRGLSTSDQNKYNIKLKKYQRDFKGASLEFFTKYDYKDSESDQLRNYNHIMKASVLPLGANLEKGEKSLQAKNDATLRIRVAKEKDRVSKILNKNGANHQATAQKVIELSKIVDSQESTDEQAVEAEAQLIALGIPKNEVLRETAFDIFKKISDSPDFANEILSKKKHWNPLENKKQKKDGRLKSLAMSNDERGAYYKRKADAAKASFDAGFKTFKNAQSQHLAGFLGTGDLSVPEQLRKMKFYKEQEFFARVSKFLYSKDNPKCRDRYDSCASGQGSSFWCKAGSAHSNILNHPADPDCYQVNIIHRPAEVSHQVGAGKKPSCDSQDFLQFHYDIEKYIAGQEAIGLKATSITIKVKASRSWSTASSARTDKRNLDIAKDRFSAVENCKVKIKGVDVGFSFDGHEVKGPSQESKAEKINMRAQKITKDNYKEIYNSNKESFDSWVKKENHPVASADDLLKEDGSVMYKNMYEAKFNPYQGFYVELEMEQRNDELMSCDELAKYLESNPNAVSGEDYKILNTGQR